MPSAQICTLSWKGPLQIPDLPVDANANPLKAPHIYLTARPYTNFTVVYAGRSANLLARLWGHYSSMLGLEYWVRDASGACIFDPGKHSMFGQLNKIDEILPHAIEDIKQSRIFYAPCDPALLVSVESMLIAHLLAHFPYEGPGPYRCDNSRRERGNEDAISQIMMCFDYVEPDHHILRDCLPDRLG